MPVSTLSLLVAPAGLLAALWTAGPVLPPHPIPDRAVRAMGCDVTVKAHNNGSTKVTIDLQASEAKIKNGLWKKLEEGGNWTVNAGGGTESKAISLSLGCTFDRQYKFLMRSGGNDRWVYYPDASTFTGERTLSLGDVSRHF